MSHYPRLFGFTVAILAAIIVGPAHAVTIATVPVGFAGNAPDTAIMTTDGTTGYGQVAYNFQIGTYDVTNAQYAEFLNAKASSADPYGLWNSSMDPTNPIAQEPTISRIGSGPFTYTVKLGCSNKPVVNVSWYDAVRFVNWLQNGQGTGDTESGTYTIVGGGNDSGTVTVPNATQRAAWAASKSFHWLLPSENEWYKAAYFNGPNATYFAYPFQSNLLPIALAPPGNANSGNFSEAATNSVSHLSDVGAYPNSLSPFGAADMGGDAGQWNDTSSPPTLGELAYGQRGGGFGGGPDISAAKFRYDGTPAAAVGFGLGFRVASVGSVPEPSTALLSALACGVIWCSRRRFKFA